MAPLSPTALILLNRAEKIFCLEEWLVRVIFDRKISYAHFMPHPKPEGYLSCVHKAEEITEEEIVILAKTKINPKREPKKFARFKVKILNDLMEHNSDIQITAKRDNEGYPYHTSVGKIPADDGLQRAVALWIKDNTVFADISVA